MKIRKYGFWSLHLATSIIKYRKSRGRKSLIMEPGTGTPEAQANPPAFLFLLHTP